MIFQTLRSATATLLMISLIVPATLFAVPQRASAFLGFGDISFDPNDFPFDIKSAVENTITTIKTSISSVANVTSAAAAVALQIDTYVLQPLAFVLSGNILKMITQGVINFVIGKANGTGVPQFAADIQASMQLLSDQQALTFFDEYMRSSKSPYSGSIIQELSRDYLNKTSLAGFWAKNMDTLRRTSPNPYGYLRGNWMYGGVTTWFALTTQQQNNPYWLKQNAAATLASRIGPGVGGVTGARVMDIRNGQGLVSWCGESDGDLGAFTTTPQGVASVARAEQSADEAYYAAYYKAESEGVGEQERIGRATVAGEMARQAEMDRTRNQNRATNGQAPLLGVNPGDPCTLDNGKTGVIKTPGSVILAGLNKALGSQTDSIVRMGNVGPEINKILSDTAQVIKTVDFAVKIFGGPGSGGLFGVDTPTRGQTQSLLRSYADSGNLGVTTSDVFATAATLPASGLEMADRLTQYKSAIALISNATNAASTSVLGLISYCNEQQSIASSTLNNTLDLPRLTTFISVSSAKIREAQTAQTTIVAPMYTRMTAASSTASAADAMVARVRNALSAGNDAAGAQGVADMNTLRTMPPTPADIAEMQHDAEISLSGASAAADPAGSLNIVMGTAIEKMNLLSANASAMRASCTAPIPSFFSATTTSGVITPP